ncbi:hypothetical protein [Streptomyces sp. HC307]|uniref:hypothetical protein n=1 Tax=Streptomyces flavusporus TaxID=3385496 RepID=UPI003916F2B8
MTLRAFRRRCVPDMSTVPASRRRSASAVSSQVVADCLESRPLVLGGGIHGRGDDPRHLLPDPEVLRRAATPHGVLIGSSHVEPAVGAQYTVRSMHELVDIARSHL